jgi:NADPH:quinone reductase-like Zn-dependent oxidoreductase
MGPPRLLVRNFIMSSNAAAWISAPKAKPFEVKAAPLGVPADGQVLVKNHAVAINPIDWKLQELSLYPLNYPTILGQDVAGEVVAVGPNVTRFKQGDRVIGLAAGYATKQDEAKAFQNYTMLQVNLCCEIPDHLSFESAVVVPYGLATAAAALFQDDFLKLQLPTEPAQKHTGKTLLVWGGASSVGSNAIQLAVAAGYEVITTASLKNFDYVKKLGASQAFDYNSSTVVSDLVAALKGKTIVGAFDAVGGAAWAPTVEVVRQSEGVKFVADTIRGFPEPPEGIVMKQVYAFSVMRNNVGRTIFEDFLPSALKSGAFSPSPAPVVAGKGLESIQAGLDLHRNGVSAQKVVVLL